MLQQQQRQQPQHQQLQHRQPQHQHAQAAAEHVGTGEVRGDQRAARRLRRLRLERVGIAAALVGMVASYRLDMPSGPAVVVAFGGAAGLHAAEVADALGAQRTLKKPIAREDLLKTISEILG